MERVLVLEGVTHRGAVRGAEAAEQCNLLYACTLLQARWQLLHSGFTFQLHCSTIPFNFNAITVSLNVAVNQLPEMHTVDEAVHLLCLGAQGTAAYCSCPTQPYCSTLESFSVVSTFAEFLTLYRHSSLHCAFHRFICQDALFRYMYLTCWRHAERCEKRTLFTVIFEVAVEFSCTACCTLNSLAWCMCRNYANSINASYCIDLKEWA